MDFATLPEPASFSSHEKSVISLVRRGYRDEEIATRLSLSIGGVKKYVDGARSKLGLQDRLELALYADYHDM